MELVGAASEHIDSVDRYLTLLSQHSLGSIAHSNLIHKLLNRVETLLVRSQLEIIRLGRHILLLDETYETF